MSFAPWLAAALLAAPAFSGELSGDPAAIVAAARSNPAGAPAVGPAEALPAAFAASASGDASARAASVIAKDATPKGFFAGKAYKQYWTRDLGYSVEALIRLGYAKNVEAHLEGLLSRQKPSGEIPTMIQTPLGAIESASPRLVLRALRYRGRYALEGAGKFASNFHGDEADSLLILLVTVKTYERMTGSRHFSEKFGGRLDRLVRYIEERKSAGGMVEGGAWYDAMSVYGGKFTLNNQIWLYKMESEYLGKSASAGIEGFWNESLGYYTDFLGGDRLDPLSNAMAINEGLVPPERVSRVLDSILKARTKYGYLDVTPLYAPAQCHERERQYQNGTIWPFTEYRIAKAFAEHGRPGEAREIQAMMEARRGFNEWYSPVDGHPDGSPDQLWSAAAYLMTRDLPK